MTQNFNLAYIIWGILGGVAVLGVFIAFILAIFRKKK